jgi:hypothetical protein
MLERVIVHLGPMDGFYTFLPEMSIASFEALNIGDKPFTYEHLRKRIGWCWGCDRALWAAQPVEHDEEGSAFHPACRWNLEAQREFETNLYKPRYVVAVYECDREMGGPEEGGWSYETGDLVASIAVNEEAAANLIADGLALEYPYTGQRGYYSRRDPDFSVRILDRHEGDELLDERLEPVAYYPITRPHYE